MREGEGEREGGIGRLIATHTVYAIYCVQHYQKDADGLCCRLKHSIDKTKDVEFVVSMSDFKDSTLLHCDVNSIFDGVAYLVHFMIIRW